MPWVELDPEKLYYSIGEVADLFDVNASTLRFWEKEFGFELKKTRKGNRQYTPKDIEKIRLIHHLVKERGFTLDGARKKMKDNTADVAKNSEAVARLQHIRSILMDLKENL